MGRRNRFPAWASLVAGVAALLLAGCASLPGLDGRHESHGIGAAGDDTPLGRIARSPAGTVGAEPSGVRSLPDPVGAFAARVILARAATRSLDVQYYIWHDDITGRLLLGELWAAAERGVRVRLLLDDNGIAGLDPVLAAMNRHDNIEVRLFNPFASRKARLLGYITDFRRLNHRMHNKSFTADESATIVGGRNVGDEYFGAGGDTLFADLDVVAFGKAARDVTAAFDAYWNSDLAWPAETILASVQPLSADALQAYLDDARASPGAVQYGNALLAQAQQSLIPADAGALEWVPVTLVCDEPVKAHGTARPSSLLLAQLLRQKGETRRSTDIVSPYFVPGSDGTAALVAAARSGIDLRILTNSLSSTDTLVVHAGYAKRREALLRAGARIHELRATAPVIDRDRSLASRLMMSGSRASLHAKTFSIDRERIFVGSFNLDQRSINLNTEMGLIIHSPSLARALSEALDRKLRGAAWEVRLQADGHGLEWIEHNGGDEVRYWQDPGTGFLARLGVRLLSFMPIEWML